MMQSTSFINKTSTNDSSKGFNEFWENVRAIVAPYWYPKEADGRAFSDVIRSWGMLFLLILLIIALVAVAAFNSFVSRNLIDIIVQEKDISKFTKTLVIYGAALVFGNIFASIF